MGRGTELGRVRGLGSARHGAGHWWQQRLTALVNIGLLLWLVTALVRLPNLEYKTVHDWLQSPLAAVPMIAIVVNTFWHFHMGLQVVIEDYQKDAARVVGIALLNLWTFAAGGFALFSILKVAFSGPVA